jgi:hypothetical protein
MIQASWEHDDDQAVHKRKAVLGTGIFPGPGAAFFLALTGGPMKAVIPRTKRETEFLRTLRALVAKLARKEAVAARLGVAFRTVDRWLMGAPPSALGKARVAEVAKELLKG